MTLFDPDVTLNDLSPEDYRRLLPELIDDIASEFNTVTLTIEASRIGMFCDDFARGILDRYTPKDGELLVSDRIRLQSHFHAAVELKMSRQDALQLARDLRRGAELLAQSQA